MTFVVVFLCTIYYIHTIDRCRNPDPDNKREESPEYIAFLYDIEFGHAREFPTRNASVASDQKKLLGLENMIRSETENFGGIPLAGTKNNPIIEVSDCDPILGKRRDSLESLAKSAMVPVLAVHRQSRNIS